VIVVIKPPGDDVAVYDSMGEPPLFVGAVNETSAVVALVRVAITLVGEPGFVAVAVAGVETNDSNDPIKATTIERYSARLGPLGLICKMTSSQFNGLERPRNYRLSAQGTPSPGKFWLRRL
jgi:hypothetical protein